MTTPTNENRDPDRAGREPETRHRLDLSVSKITAGACASALAAAVGSKLGVAGTIAGAAVASAVATSASAVIGHSLERGREAARKAMPALDPEQLETAILARVRAAARTEPMARETRAPADTRAGEPAALTRADETQVLPSLASLADRALGDSHLDETVVLDGRTRAALEARPPMGPHAQTMLLQTNPDDARRGWRDRLPGRKPLLAAAVASFMIGTGAVTALEVARKGEFPGYHSNVFTNDPGRGSGSHDQPSRQNPGGSSSREGTTPSQKPDSPSPTPSGSGSASPSTTPSTPPTPDSTPSTAATTPPTPATGPTTPSSGPTSATTGGAGPTSVPSTVGGPAPSSTAGLGMGTPTGGPTG